mmetsp:Transcript_7995/g.20147  ORF Transcript_7995/g.20147 Transcript_7995/m.20147 type:complete len:406 (-) Transcript_7995:295-1512(-)|eukprot:CAMPEP_0177654534 /NCGR_PEP_ID=MMETSP0447-20121125/14391_1 /TAXON_ID=0 /ORGANISM="Stygamoeba regulata, Strain BSH-02190019" /LENGTH=405 /DNA_ID=CAMNT_0019158205 /DNA_START=170 /DNA_END=1387 /DNA_ORIENTATION=+
MEESSDLSNPSILLSRLRALDRRLDNGLTDSVSSECEAINIHLEDIVENLPRIIEASLDDPDNLERMLLLNDAITSFMKKWEKEKEKKLVQSSTSSSPTLQKQSPSTESSSTEEAESFEYVVQLADNETEPSRQGFVDPNHEPIECNICCDDISGPQVYTLACDHKYCFQCLESHVAAKLDSGEVNDLRCPDPSCLKPIEYVDVRAFCKSPEVFEKYQTMSLVFALKAEPNTRWCPKCGLAFLINGDGDGATSVVACPNTECKTEFCSKCNEQHAGMTCEEFKVTNKEEKRFKRWKRSHKTKLCPKCGAVIQKNKGCNHMTCGNCHYDFCWLCMGEVVGDHYAAEGPCKGKQFPRKARVKMVAAITGIAVVAVPVVLVGVAVALPIAVVGGAAYGGYRLVRFVKK